MAIRTIDRIVAPPAPHMVGDGFRVHNFFPGLIDMYRMSPFFLLDYNSPVVWPPRENPRGVGVHPHRGFETVSFAYKGSIAHHDSAGNSGVINEGDVQWMTAAEGVLHKEYHEQEYSRRGGDFQMVQLWVNLPAAYKMSPAKYQAITRAEWGKYVLPNNAGMVNVLAGEFTGIEGPASTFTPISIYEIQLKAGSSVTLATESQFNTCILMLGGEAVFNDKETAPADHLALLNNDGDELTVKATRDSLLLFLSGEPIREPIVAYGPFVMNTRDEILQAYADFNSGKFGTLED